MRHLAVVADHRAAAVGAFMQILLSQQNCSSFFQTPNDFRILGRDPVFEQSAGGGGANAGGIDQVFHRQRDSMQRSTPVSAQDLSFGSLCLRKSQLRGYGDEGIQRGVESFDLREAVLRQLHGRQLPFAQQLGSFHDGCKHVPSFRMRSHYPRINYRLTSLLRSCKKPIIFSLLSGGGARITPWHR